MAFLHSLSFVPPLSSCKKFRNKRRKGSLISLLGPWKLGACISFGAYQMQACGTFYTQRIGGLEISNVTFNVEME
jgi:hypothetical protein